MIRKTILSNDALPLTRGAPLESIASFQVSSESSEHPLENALQPDDTFWLAEVTGIQVIQIQFDSPQEVSRITLIFDERHSSRMQEFALSWRSSTDSTWQELRRQQFNFSPPHTTQEREEFRFSLKTAAALKLEINPSVSGTGRATLTYLAIEAEPTT